MKIIKPIVIKINESISAAISFEYDTIVAHIAPKNCNTITTARGFCNNTLTIA
ncbi:MAG: hypothetical protein Q6368_006730 [Candidatus Baldrarchaeota archaeon]